MMVLPVVERELCVASRRSMTYWLRFWTVLAAMLFFAIIFTGSNLSPAQQGVNLIHSLGVLVMAYCLLCGVFLTADSLSGEKRDGTLGLLFLTDLKSRDIILGKLAASSLHGFFGLLAVFPILGLPLLLGGVSGREFSRLLLVFLATQFFTLGAGLWVSARCRSTRNTMIAALMLMVLFTGGFPLASLVVRSLHLTGEFGWLLWPSPFFSFVKAFDADYAPAYWYSILILFGLGLLGIADGARVLLRVWQREAGVAPSFLAQWLAFFGIKRLNRVLSGLSARATVRPGRNPYYWLTVREGGGVMTCRLLVLALGLLWAGCLWGAVALQNDDLFACHFFILLAMHICVKLLIAVEASRRFFEDRNSGAMELLLATPITQHQVFAGFCLGMKRIFFGYLGAISLMNLVTWCFMVFCDTTFLHMRTEEKVTFSIIFLGGIVVLWVDFHALTWLGMLRGLRARKHFRAVLAMIAVSLLPPWLFIFFLAALQISGGNDTPIIVSALWLLGGAALSLVASSHARVVLGTSFRTMATGGKPPG